MLVEPSKVILSWSSVLLYLMGNFETGGVFDCKLNLGCVLTNGDASSELLACSMKDLISNISVWFLTFFFAKFLLLQTYFLIIV